MEKPPSNPGRRLTDQKNQNENIQPSVLETFQYSIEKGTYNIKEWYAALKAGTINITQHESLVTLLTKNLETDALTKLFTRVHLDSELDRVREELNHEVKPDEKERKLQVKSVMVIYLDIDKMKVLNDAHPDHHTVGDKALVMVADLLRKETRRSDVLFRVGGDEFLAILSLPINGENSRSLEAIFERIKNKISTTLSVNVDGKDIPFSVSLGYSMLHKGDKISGKDLLKIADGKMYQHKKGPKE